jgi:hypothetical protein
MKQLLFDITFVTFLCYKSDLSVRLSCIFFVSFVCSSVLMKRFVNQLKLKIAGVSYRR